MNTQNLSEYPDILTIEDVKAILRIGTNSAYRLLRSGSIYYLRIGKNIRVPKACLEDYLRTASKPGEEVMRDV